MAPPPPVYYDLRLGGHDPLEVALAQMDRLEDEIQRLRSDLRSFGESSDERGVARGDE